MQRENIKGREIFYIEQLRIGELRDESVLGQLPEELCSRVKNEIRQSDDELFQRLPPREFADEVRRKTRGGISGYQRQMWAGKALPLAAAAVFTILIGVVAIYPSLDPGTDAPVERIKGMEPMLHIYRAEGEEAKLLENSTVAQEYDLLQLEYNAAGFSYGIIFSIDGRGTVTLHYPVAGSNSPELLAGSVLLPYSYELDDAPGFERFFFVVSDRDFSQRQVLENAERLAAEKDHGRHGQLELPEEFNQYSLTILKEDD